MQLARERLIKYSPVRPKQPQPARAAKEVKGTYTVVPETLGSFRPSEIEKAGPHNSMITSFLHESGFPRMTQVQRLLFGPILSGQNVFGGAETGSGKTLAYLLPLIQRLKENEKENGLILVCVPTRELVNQVLQVSKQLAHHCKFRPRTLQHADWSQGDLLVALPRELMGEGRRVLFEKGRKIGAVVIDEADTLLLDPGFSEDVRLVLDATPRAQKIAVSATMPPNLLKRLNSLVPGIQVRTTQGFLKPVPTLKQLFTDLKVPQAQKASRCLELLKQDANLKSQRNLIFCNNIPTAQRLYGSLLGEPGLQVALLHGRVSPVQRGNVLKAFQAGVVRNLIATDLLARGVDLHVDNVVLYDFPHTLAEYLHRVGRTARAGKAGRVFAMITSRDRPFFFKIKSMLPKVTNKLDQ